MSKLIRHAQKRGTALFLALQLTGLVLLSSLSFIGGPQSRDGGTPAETQVSAPAQQAASAAADALQHTALTAADLTAAEKTALRKSAVTLRKSCTNRSPRRYLIWQQAVLNRQPQHPAEGPESPTEGHPHHRSRGLPAVFLCLFPRQRIRARRNRGHDCSRNRPRSTVIRTMAGGRR